MVVLIGLVYHEKGMTGTSGLFRRNVMGNQTERGGSFDLDSIDCIGSVVVVIIASFCFFLRF